MCEYERSIVCEYQIGIYEYRTLPLTIINNDPMMIFLVYRFCKLQIPILYEGTQSLAVLLIRRWIIKELMIAISINRSLYLLG